MYGGTSRARRTLLLHLSPSDPLPARDLRSRHRGCGRPQRRSPSEQVLLKSASATARERRARPARLGSDALGARDSAHARGEFAFPRFSVPLGRLGQSRAGACARARARFPRPAIFFFLPFFPPFSVTQFRHSPQRSAAWIPVVELR